MGYIEQKIIFKNQSNFDEMQSVQESRAGGYPKSGAGSPNRDLQISSVSFSNKKGSEKKSKKTPVANKKTPQ